MLVKVERKKESKTKIPIVNFLDIDISKITFKQPKSNKYNGSQIGILYNGDTMYVKYEGIAPFGLRENFDKDGNYQNTSMQINCEGDYLEKAKELDEFFIDSFYANKWGLNNNIPLDHIRGYDEHGQGGLWKRLCKAPYKLDSATAQREYLNSPSKMEFTLFYKNDCLQTTMFSWDGKMLQNDQTEIGPNSRVKFIAGWFSLSRGTFGLTLKPKLMQIKFKPENIIFDSFLLADSEEEEKDIFYVNPYHENVKFTLDSDDVKHENNVIQPIQDNLPIQENLDPEWYFSK